MHLSPPPHPRPSALPTHSTRPPSPPTHPASSMLLHPHNPRPSTPLTHLTLFLLHPHTRPPHPAHFPPISAHTHGQPPSPPPAAQSHAHHLLTLSWFHTTHPSMLQPRPRPFHVPCNLSASHHCPPQPSLFPLSVSLLHYSLSLSLPSSLSPFLPPSVSPSPCM